jgi:hypothetical protein
MYALVRRKDGFRRPPVDDDDTGVFMVWPTLAEAEIGKQHQIDTYDLLEEGDEWDIVPLADLPPVKVEDNP